MRSCNPGYFIAYAPTKYGRSSLWIVCEYSGKHIAKIKIMISKYFIKDNPPFNYLNTSIILWSKIRISKLIEALHIVN
jgi:hypothetical protein